jgi:hypothetical protein
MVSSLLVMAPLAIVSWLMPLLILLLMAPELIGVVDWAKAAPEQARPRARQAAKNERCILNTPKIDRRIVPACGNCRNQRCYANAVRA